MIGLPSAFGLIVVSLAISIWAWVRTRDIVNPLVFFPPLYAYCSTGPVLYAAMTGGGLHLGIIVDLIPTAYRLGTLCMLGFLVGGILAGAFRVRSNGLSVLTVPQSERESSQLIRAAAGCLSFLCMLMMAYCLQEIFGTSLAPSKAGKQGYFLLASPRTLMLLRLSSWFSGSFLIIVIISDLSVSKTGNSPLVIGLLTLYSLICMYGGERDFVLVAGLWLACRWKQLPTSVKVSAALLTVFVTFALPAMRAHGLGISGLSKGAAEMDSDEMLRSALRLSPNLLTLTNTVDLIEQGEPYWRGASLVKVILSFSPFRSEWVNYTPTYWFADNYWLQGDSGFAYSQDAEAYLNFGTPGCFFWFLGWGLFMGTIYRRASSPNRTSLDIFLWWNSIGGFLFSIRSDIRTPIKLMVYGLLAYAIIHLIASIEAKQQRRTPAPPVAAPQKRAA